MRCIQCYRLDQRIEQFVVSPSDGVGMVKMTCTCFIECLVGVPCVYLDLLHHVRRCLYIKIKIKQNYYLSNTGVKDQDCSPIPNTLSDVPSPVSWDLSLVGSLNKSCPELFPFMGSLNKNW